MKGSSSLLQQLQTIDYIKKLAQSFEEQDSSQPSESNMDSLIVSESSPSQGTLKLTIRRGQLINKEKYGNKYVSPYRQHGMSIRKIQATARQPLTPQVSFTNTLLQIATSRERQLPKDNASPSRYRAASSMMDKLELTALDQLRVEARRMHELQEKQKMEMSPRQRNEKWADFLLRERKWQEQKRTREMEMRQKAFAEQRDSGNKGDGRPREASKMTREDLIRKVKRQKSKLEQRLRQISQNSYKWKNVNIIGERKASPKRPRAASNRLMVADPRQALFLVQRGDG